MVCNRCAMQHRLEGVVTYAEDKSEEHTKEFMDVLEELMDAYGVVALQVDDVALDSESCQVPDGAKH